MGVSLIRIFAVVDRAVIVVDGSETVVDLGVVRLVVWEIGSGQDSMLSELDRRDIVLIIV